MVSNVSPRYAELQCRTHYSFLRGASHPSELVQRASELGLTSLAVTDRNGVYGMPKAYLAIQKYPGLKLIVGAELMMEAHPPLTLIARDRSAYGILCRIITTAHADKAKGDAFLRWDELASHLAMNGANGLIALPRIESATRLAELRELFGDRLYLPVSRFLDGRDQDRLANAREISQKLDIKLVATNDVHYHVSQRRALQDTLTSIREGVTLQQAGYRLHSNSERYLKSPQEMATLFADLPEALNATIEISDSCTFSPSELRYRYPSEWIPKNHSAQSYLKELVEKGTQNRYPQGTPQKVTQQIDHELTLIEKLGFADYFLTIWEIVEFARGRKILCQGRGSAANSVVCYCLGITAIDPVRMTLLFERFISAERGEPPDIDVDFEHERREEVIQHIYEKYGRDRAAMVATTICYRKRSSIREVTKVFGHEIGRRAFEKLQESTGSNPPLPLSVVNPLLEEIEGIPRHLGIHSGGFTLSADPIIETVPVEPARMENRTIVQWDKYDLDALGLLKVDVLSLGMLSVLRKTLDMTGQELASLPAEDPATYKMIQAADTIGVFQIESRAQMSMLPRLLPKNFYDLVIEVALVRPGPIVGKMVHPYLKRRRGLEKADYPHPDLEPILKRTLGVPLFQEQVMQIAIKLAGFTPGEADELRRAIGAWRSAGSIDKMGHKLMQGLLAAGVPRDFAERVFLQIQGFAEYGFPESHAASFALLAYASAYLKCHHPAEFACALINSQPMGFYAPHTIVDDAKRHGVRIYPLDPNISEWDCVLESGALRIGWRSVQGMHRAQFDALERERKKNHFKDLEDFLQRTRLRPTVLHRLALGDTFARFNLAPREALWRILALDPSLRARPSEQLDLLTVPNLVQSTSFAALNEYQTISAQYDAFALSTQGHPMKAVRAATYGLPDMDSARARAAPHGRNLAIPGISVVMQRPPTAKGTVFATLEDEFGLLDLIIHEPVFKVCREHILEHCFLIVKGKIQRDGQALSLVVQSLVPFPAFQEIALKPSLSDGVRFGR